MAAIDDVIAWAQSLPNWQADAIRRLLLAGDDPLTEDDQAELLALAKAALGLALAPEGLTPMPPQAGTLSGVPAAAAEVKLLAISNVQNVNIIKTGETQPFAENGITVIYGGNGSGKSGYSRVLKLACQARDKEDNIIPNVFAALPGTPTATLRIKENGAPQDIAWKLGAAPAPVLTNICVFDGRCSRIITDERNEVTYSPYGTHVFERLVALLLRIRTSIEAEQMAPVPIQDSLIPADSPSGVFLQSLSAATNAADIATAAAWTPDDDVLLAGKETLALSSASRTAMPEIERLTRLRTRVLSAGEKASALATETSSYGKDAIAKVLVELRNATQAHAIAVAERRTTEPLPGVGASSQWEILYSAAKKYSEEIAYPGVPFPKTVDALCVLCQQPLQAEAVARFARFKAFIEDATSGVLTTKRAALAAMRQSLESMEALEGAGLDAVCDEIIAADAATGEALRQFYLAFHLQRNLALSALAEDAPIDVPSRLGAWPDSPQSKLIALAEKIAEQIATINATAQPEEYKRLLTEISHLKARQALHKRRADIESLVSQAKRNQALRDAAATIRTQEITRQGTVIIRRHRTPDLLASVQTELTALGVRGIPISVKPSGTEGATAHEFVLQGTPFPVRARMSEVLSEGEARVIGIAGFLAELRLAPQIKSIVFDDPVSSLDHVFTRKIAERLIREALTRQIIIFTHNIGFLMELQDAQATQAKAGQPVHYEVHTLRREADAAGITTQGVPWYSMSVNQRAHYLEGLLHACKALYGADTPKYNREAAHIYALLREAWESCVEDDVFYSVVCRYRNSVQTLKLMEVAIEDPDVHTIDLNISKTSTWMLGHAKSRALDQDRPAPDEILQDIAALRAFSKVIKARREPTQKRRKSQLAA